jgi:ABC-2 type transport system ATP-binding protein
LVYCRFDKDVPYFFKWRPNRTGINSDMADDVLIDVQGISRYYGEHCAVNDISFTVNRGQVLGFLGPNGAGKTTTMNMLTGNLAPSAGSIRINGHDLLDEPRAAKGAIGYLPEQPPLYRELTVDEYLDYCAALNGLPRDRRRAARDAAKEKCGLNAVSRRLIGNLSKGYRQRVGIAQAIIHLPPVVILDEPTVGLDPLQIREIRQLIRDLGREHSVIISTHILPEVQATCDEVQIISEGRLVLRDRIDNLHRHMQSASLTVGFRHDASPDALQAIADVTAVEPLDHNYYRVFYAPDRDPTDDLVRLAVAKGWGLLELRRARLSLEEVFLKLTTDDAAHTPQEDAA